MFETFSSWENLLHAWRKASRGKRGHPNVAAFEHRLEDHLLALQTELRERTYRPGRYRSFFIHEPKRRLISAAPFRDRVVHHALCNLIEPLLERSFVAESFANRKGKGTHRALDRCQQLARRFPFFLQLDLRQFFPSIDHAILRQILEKKIRDPAVLWLIFPERRRLKRRKGIFFFRRFRSAMEAHARGELSLQQLRAICQGWINHVRYANTAGLREALLGGGIVTEPSRAEAEQAWIGEALRRDAEMESGEVEGIPGEEVFRRIRTGRR